MKLLTLAAGASATGVLAGATASAANAPWQISAAVGITAAALLTMTLLPQIRKGRKRGITP